MEKTTSTIPIRELMPEGYLNLIHGETGMAPANICTVVNNESRKSYIWPVVERIAKENDSKAYAARVKYLEKREVARQALKQAHRKTAA